jgi:hypothetical protein
MKNTAVCLRLGVEYVCACNVYCEAPVCGCQCQLWSTSMWMSMSIVDGEGDVINTRSRDKKNTDGSGRYPSIFLYSDSSSAENVWHIYIGFYHRCACCVCVCGVVPFILLLLFFFSLRVFSYISSLLHLIFFAYPKYYRPRFSGGLIKEFPCNCMSWDGQRCDEMNQWFFFAVLFLSPSRLFLSSIYLYNTNTSLFSIIIIIQFFEKKNLALICSLLLTCIANPTVLPPLIESTNKDIPG